MSFGPNREICRYQGVYRTQQFLGVDLRVAVDEEGKLPCDMGETYFESVSLALVPVISHNLELLVCKFLDNFSSAIIAAIVDDDYFVVFGHRLKLLVHICDASSDAVRLVVRGHDDGDSVFHETFDELKLRMGRMSYCHLSENAPFPPVRRLLLGLQCRERENRMRS